MSQESKSNCTRRNRALRKVRSSKHIPREIKPTIQALIDFLGPKTDYSLAWPSVQTLATQLQLGPRTVRWHLKAIRKTGIFKWHHFSPSEAREFCQRQYGFHLSLTSCSHQAPTFYLVNNDHPLWDEAMKLPEPIDQAMGEIIESVKKERSRKTTSRLSTDPTKRPRVQPRYDISAIRQRLRIDLDACPSNVANDSASNGQVMSREHSKGCRERQVK